MKVFFVFTVISCSVSLVFAGVPLALFESLVNKQNLDLGLYNSSDKVNIVTDANFKETIINQNRANLLEFYNSYCGHCKRFAPVYKTLAAKIHSWRDVLLVSAIDCAAESNNGLCREYEIMGYPTLRFMSPGFVASEGNYGRNILSQDIGEIENQLALWIVEENRTDLTTKWPNLQLLSEPESNELFANLSKETKYVFLVFEPDNSTIGVQTILHFSRFPDIAIRRVADGNVATKYQINQDNKIASVDREGVVLTYSVEDNGVEGFIEKIQSVLSIENLTEKPVVTKSNVKKATDLNTQFNTLQNEKILEEVVQNKHVVYQADLEMAVRGLLFNEIPRQNNLSGERLLALQRLLSVINRYNPLGENGHIFVKQLIDFVYQFNQNLTGTAYEKKLKELEAANKPIFSSSHYVGCAASKPTLRGFTCSLWQLFHFFTVQSAESEDNQDPLEVLQAIHGYVKYFFGCTDCAEHFQNMANRRKIWSVPNKEEAILWLWGAHNEVNNRLAKDETEDPKFPKIQFPSEESCSTCFKQETSTSANMETNWDKDAVLTFLKSIHHPTAISRYGVDDENVLQPNLERIRQKRMVGNIFSDVDMRMGLFLYGFCIVMMVAAFKLFVFKGYRKKPYGYDILGKV